jgi:aerobic carbon-monoxide dehydrogenase medium subunit
MISAQFDYEAPKTLDEAFALLSKNDDAKLLAGGHSLLPAMKLRLAAPSVLVDLGRIQGLAYIREAGDKIAIGAMTTHADVAASDLLERDSPLLKQNAEHIGDVQVRNRGTLGGSLAHADPAADYPAAILALDAELVARSQSGERTIAARDFFTGLFSTALQAGEILTEIRVPKTRDGRTAYAKFHHPASGFAVAGVAVVVHVKGGNIQHAEIGITGIAPSAYRATKVEEALRGKDRSAIADASQHAADGVEPLSDYFASAEYRKHLAAVYTQRALEAAFG